MFKLNMRLNVVLLALLLSIISTNALRGKANTKSATKTHTEGSENHIMYTAWNDRGESHWKYLDRHRLDCSQYGNYFINGFQFQRNGDQIRYKYSCTPFSFTGQKTSVKYFY